jgi:hypothetical protein
VRASLRHGSCVLLGAVVGLGSPVVRAADDERAHRDLEARTRLDLDWLWQEYRRKGETRSFEQYVDARFRVRRDVGRGLVVGGASLGVVAAAMFFLALPRDDAARVTYSSYGVMALSVGMMITGGVMWGRNFRRIESIENTGYALSSRGRVRLISAGPVALPRGGGVSFGLAF